jgi:hypothetical protein
LTKAIETFSNAYKAGANNVLPDAKTVNATIEKAKDFIGKPPKKDSLEGELEEQKLDDLEDELEEEIINENLLAERLIKVSIGLIK